MPPRWDRGYGPVADHGQYVPERDDRRYRREGRRREYMEDDRGNAGQSFAEGPQHRGRAPPQQERAEQHRETQREDYRPGNHGRAPPPQRRSPQQREDWREDNYVQRGRFQDFTDRRRI
ncbi:uncharacterized protein ACO6RY_06508 [Pungitius sinensis]